MEVGAGAELAPSAVRLNVSRGTLPRIERLTNGYEVSVRDPKIVEANRKSNSSYKNPCREYVFTDVKSVLLFLEKNLDKALPADDFDSSFDAAVADMDDEEDDD